MSKNLFVITHTESRHHVDDVVGGWHDTELTEKGRKDAEKTAGRLSSLIGDQDVEIFSSDLLRASQTADAIARRFRLAAILMSDLREMSYGDAEGRPRQWLLSRQTPPHDNRLDDRGGIENAETRREFAARIYRAVDAIVRRPCSTQNHCNAWICVELRCSGLDQDAD